MYVIETATSRISDRERHARPETVLSTYFHNDEVNHRPATWQQVVCNSVNSAKVYRPRRSLALHRWRADFFSTSSLSRPPLLYWKAAALPRRRNPDRKGGLQCQTLLNPV